MANPITDQVATADAPFSFQFATDAFDDLDGNTLTYTATLDDSSPLPGWLTFSAATRTFSGAPDNDDVGSITVRVTADDGNGGSVYDDFALTVTTGVNTSAPSSDSTTEDTDLVFSVASTNAITVDDGTAGDPILRTTLTVTNGTLKLATTGGLTSVTGDGSSTVTVIGMESAINTALDGLTYSPTDDYNGPANLQVTTDLQADLLGRYEFTQANPLGDDSSPAGGNDGTPSAGPGPDPNAVFDGDRNSDVLVLDGNNDNIEIAGRFGTPTDVTIAGWVNVAASNNQEFVSIGGSIALRLNDNNNGDGVTGFYHDGSSWNHTDSMQFIGGDGWHHVAFTFDDVNDTQVIYVDGIALGTTSYAGSINWAHQPNTTIGSHANGSSFLLDGMLDDTRIYDRALSAGEIQALATDQFSDTETVSITVDPVNDAPTVVNAISAQSATEDTAFSFQFALNTFNDVDGDTLSYSATLDDSSPLPSWLTFDPGTRTFSGTPLNADVGAITVRVTANDGNGGTEFDDFVVTVGNDNDAPTGITLSNSTVPENADGAVVGSLTAMDPDIGDTHTFTVDDSRFEIVGTQLKLRAGQSLDKETEPTVNLLITTTDQAGAGLDYDQGFTIVVSNVNESPTDITLSNNSVLEGEAGAIIATIGVFDPDAAETFAWSVDDNRFEVVGNQLKLKAAASLDSDVEPTVSVVITVTDQGGAGLNFGKAFTINVGAVIPIPIPVTTTAGPSNSSGDSGTDDESSDDSDSDDNSSNVEDSVTVIAGGESSSGRGTASNSVRDGGIILVGEFTDADDDQDSLQTAAFVDVFLQSSRLSNSQLEGNDNPSTSENDRGDRGSVADRARRQLQIYSQADYALMSSPGKMWDQLDQQRSFVESQVQNDLILIGTTGAAASSFTVGVVAWALRSGFLVSGLMAQLPLYRAVDPLLIMNSTAGARGGESLAEMMDRQSKELDE